MEEIARLDHVYQYNELMGIETLHPLVSVIDMSKCPRMRHSRRLYGFYCIFLKDVKCGDLRYGRNYYDYQEGTLVFTAPGQVVGVEDNGEVFQPKGWALLFHPDLLRGTQLGRNIRNYTFFSYEVREALHLSEQERRTILDCLHNIRLIMENDQYLRSIVFNQLADGMEISGEVPWKHPARFWRDADDAQLICYVDASYGTFSARNYDIAVQKAADDRSYHPIREYFSRLPEWDGIERIDTMLIDYLGADDNAYIRAVSRKIMCAAVQRVYHPGIKFDHILVLNGPQGIGKSTFIGKLGGEWYSDSLNLSDMNDKTAAEKLQGYWILEIGELAGMKKADIDKVKAFISRQDDKYRASFGRRVTPHPRQCVFFGTTNSENGFLRDVTGNRRFWTVRVPGGDQYKPWNLTEFDIDMMWAEAFVYVKEGEPLFLPAELESYARMEQSAAMEQDDREGLVIRYLDTFLPTDWDTMDIYKRRSFLQNPDEPTQPVGSVRRETVSNIEIWCECFGKLKEDIKPADSYAITAIMTRISGWEKNGTKKRLPIYGLQRIYTRKG